LIRKSLRRKGSSAFDPLFLSIFLFMALVSVLIIGMSFVKIKDAILDNGMLNDTPQAVTMLNNGVAQFPVWMDNSFFFLI
jgi:hypothetical protein